MAARRKSGPSGLTTVIHAFIERTDDRMCKRLERSKYIEASLISNPVSKRSSGGGVKSLERTIAHTRGVCRAWLQPAPGKASSAFSERFESVRSDRGNAPEFVC